MKKSSPSIDEWLKEAKADPAALQEGMLLVHNGVVRQTPKAKVRQGIYDGSLVKGMEFAYDAEKKLMRRSLKPIKWTASSMSGFGLTKAGLSLATTSCMY
jgi:hypothetical protein